MCINLLLYLGAGGPAGPAAPGPRARFVEVLVARSHDIDLIPRAQAGRGIARSHDVRRQLWRVLAEPDALRRLVVVLDEHVRLAPYIVPFCVQE